MLNVPTFFLSYTDREMELLSLLTQGPVAVAIDATTWHNYIGGIIQFHCSENVNHAVQIVGYDLTGKKQGRRKFIGSEIVE